MALLTLLRLYAILKALGYYRHLRRFNDLQARLSLLQNEELPVGAQPQHQLVSLAPDFETAAKGSLWPRQSLALSLGNAQGHLISPRPSATDYHLATPTTDHFRLAPLLTLPSGYADQQQQPLSAGSLRPHLHQHQAAGGSLGGHQHHLLRQQQQSRASSKLRPFDRTADRRRRQQSRDAQKRHEQEAGRPLPVTQSKQQPPTNSRHAAPALLLLGPTPPSRPKLGPELKSKTLPHPAAAKPIPRRRSKLAHRMAANRPTDLSAPNVLLVNGRPHRLVGPHEAGFESEPPLPADEPEPASDQSGPELAANESDRNLLGASKPAAAAATTYTLLSASQLEQLSRKLMAAGSDAASLKAGGSGGPAGSGAAKYKLIARYKPMRSALATVARRQRQRLPAGSTRPAEEAAGGLAASSSSSGASSEDLAELGRPAGRSPEGPLAGGRGLRQSEELVNVLDATAAKSLAGRDDLLPGKCKFQAGVDHRSWLPTTS